MMMLFDGLGSKFQNVEMRKKKIMLIMMMMVMMMMMMRMMMTRSQWL